MLENSSGTSFEESSNLENFPLNFEETLAQFDGNTVFVMKLVTGFTENLEKKIDIIRKAIAERDAEGIFREAHNIKGGAATIGAEAVTGIAAELETILTSGDFDKSTETLSRLEKELLRLKVFITTR